MHLGIVAALADEARILSAGPVSTETAILVGNSILLRLSGMGSARARAAASGLVEQGAEALISWGVAAGLCPDLRPGSLVIPEKILGQEGEEYPVDRSWSERVSIAIGASISVNRGTISECGSIKAGTQEKSRIFARTGAVAMDMESAAIAAVADRAGLRFIAVRAIADSLETTIPHCALASIDEFGRPRVFKLIMELARRPGEIAGLIKLGTGHYAALRSLQMAAEILKEYNG